MIEVGDWRIVRRDAMNLETIHRHKVKAIGFARGKQSAGDVRWVRTGNYFQSVAAAAEFIIGRELTDGAGNADTLRSLREFLAIEADLRESFAASLSKIDSAAV